MTIATHIPSPRTTWREAPVFPILLLFSLYIISQKNNWLHFPQFPSFLTVDTLSDTNWTQTAIPNLSLTRVQTSGLLHHKIWILPFDEMWHLGLTAHASPHRCAGAHGPVEWHVSSGSSVAAAASQIAGRVRRSRRVAPLLPLGRPFLLEHGGDREIVHAFALLVEGVFPRRSRKWFPEVARPVQFVQRASSFMNASAVGAVREVERQFCSEEKLRWMLRALSYAVRRFKLKGIVPKSNPMDDARYNEAICCRATIDQTEDLKDCALECDGKGLYNILSFFPET